MHLQAGVAVLGQLPSEELVQLGAEDALVDKLMAEGEEHMVIRKISRPEKAATSNLHCAFWRFPWPSWIDVNRRDTAAVRAEEAERTSEESDNVRQRCRTGQRPVGRQFTEDVLYC